MEKLGFSRGQAEKENYAEAKEKVTASLKDYFRPEFLNRLDDIIVFDILSPEAVKEIVRLQVAIVEKRLLEKEIRLELLPEVYSYLTKEGYNPQYGARPLKRLIQSKILSPVASLIISKKGIKGSTIEVGMKNAEFTFEVHKKKSHPSPLSEMAVAQ
jgi:ATP-dependent Clp protease ATP-binding subunit ClpA